MTREPSLMHNSAIIHAATASAVAGSVIHGLLADMAATTNPVSSRATTPTPIFPVDLLMAASQFSLMNPSAGRSHLTQRGLLP
jgi:hypothetical protein